MGSHVHIASFTSITGGGDFSIGDFSTISSGVRICTGTDNPYLLHNSTIPDEYRDVERSYVRIGDYAFVGVGSIVMPGVTIGEGAVVGAGSLVLKDLDPWCVFVGNPIRAIRSRCKEPVLELANKVREYDE